MPESNISTCQDAAWDVANVCPLVVLYNMSVADVNSTQLNSTQFIKKWQPEGWINKHTYTNYNTKKKKKNHIVYSGVWHLVRYRYKPFDMFCQWQSESFCSLYIQWLLRGTTSQWKTWMLNFPVTSSKRSWQKAIGDDRLTSATANWIHHSEHRQRF